MSMNTIPLIQLEYHGRHGVGRWLFVGADFDHFWPCASSISANFRRYRFVLIHNQGEGITSSTGEYEHYLDQKNFAKNFSILPSKFHFSILPQSFNFTSKLSFLPFGCSILANFRRYRFVLIHNQDEGITSSIGEYEHYLDQKKICQNFFNFTLKVCEFYLKLSFWTFGCSISANIRRYQFMSTHKQGEGITSSTGEYEPYLEPKISAKKKACPEGRPKIFWEKKASPGGEAKRAAEEKSLRGRPAVFAGEKKLPPFGRLLPVWEN